MPQPSYATNWVQIAGDGLVFNGPCIVKSIIFWPHTDDQYADIYDGRDATSGKKFCRVEAYTPATRHISFGQGVQFGRGIYVNAKHREDETTVAFIPLPLAD